MSSAASSIFNHCVGCDLFGLCGRKVTTVFGKNLLEKTFLLADPCALCWTSQPTYHQHQIVIINVFDVAHGNLLPKLLLLLLPLNLLFIKLASLHWIESTHVDMLIIIVI